jgi:hypothetical protein
VNLVTGKNMDYDLDLMKQTYNHHDKSRVNALVPLMLLFLIRKRYLA